MALIGSKIIPIRNVNQFFVFRSICVSSARCLKEVVEKQSSDGKTVTIEGVYVESPRQKKLVDFEKLRSSGLTNYTCQEHSDKFCPLCRSGLVVKHTDVLILQQFLDTSGNLLERKITGLCLPQHRRMNWLIQMAKLAGILKTPLDEEPTTRPGYLKYNKYYDESVIDEWLAGSNRRKL